MRHVGWLVILLGCCWLDASSAWAEHTRTLPGLQPGWGGTAVQASDRVDPGTPQWILGDKLVKALNAGDVRTLTSLVNLDGLVERVFPDRRRNPQASRYVDDALLGDLVRATLASYCKGVNGTHGTAKLLEVKMHAGQPRIRVRVDQGVLGFTYLEFTGEQDPTGEFRVIQWDELNEGRLASETLIAIIRLAVGPDDNNFGMVDKIRKIEVLRGQGRYAESLQAMGYLSQEAAESLEILKMRAGDARRVNHMSEYNHALDLIDSKYGDDWTLALILADNYIDKSEIDKAVRGVDALEGRVGVDAGTCLMRAHMLAQARRYDESLAYARRAVSLEPDLDSAWYSLAKGYVRLKDYPRAVAAYTSMQARFHTNFTRETFSGDPDFSAFAQSGAFKKWLAQ